MLTRTLSWLLLAWMSVSPTVARDPANPDSAIPPAHYNPLLSGSQSYRPVEPLPWGDVNRRVMPPDPLRSAPEQSKAAPEAKQEKRGPHDQH
jgi:hypothetical protein